MPLGNECGYETLIHAACPLPRQISTNLVYEQKKAK